MTRVGFCVGVRTFYDWQLGGQKKGRPHSLCELLNKLEYLWTVIFKSNIFTDQFFAFWSMEHFFITLSCSSMSSSSCSVPAVFFKLCGFLFRRTHEPNLLIFTWNRSGFPPYTDTHSHTLLHLIKVVEVCVGRWIWWKSWGARKCFTMCVLGGRAHMADTHTYSWDLSVFTLFSLTVLKLYLLSLSVSLSPSHRNSHPVRTTEAFIRAGHEAVDLCMTMCMCVCVFTLADCQVSVAAATRPDLLCVFVCVCATLTSTFF